jgi:nucleotide-binding universal stress UspA family protein
MEVLLAFNQILVPLNGSDRDEIALGSAFTIATHSNAHVMSLFVRPDMRFATRVVGLPLLANLVADISRSTKQLADETSRAAHRNFTMAAIEAKASITNRPEGRREISASFHEAEGYVFECVGRAAKFADLLVYGPFGEPEDFQTSTGFTEALMNARRPVLITPRKILGPFRKVAIGWDGGHATARAVCGALSLLAAAETVEIIVITRSAVSQAGEFNDLRDYLALSGIQPAKRIIDKAVRSIGEELIETATSNGADLLVMGGYGHSLLRESLFGGTTAFAIDEPSLPIFLAH